MALDPSQQRELFPKLVRAYEEEKRRVQPKRYADKSHPNIWIAEALSEVFPDAQFLGIERDPFGTVASMLKHKGVLKWHA